MEKNVGSKDKIIRYIGAAICALLAITVNWLFWIPAVLLAATAAFGFCGLYKLLGINTCKMK